MSKKQSTPESTTKRTRRKFSDEYKIEAVKMVTEQGDKVAEAARNLGINVNQLHRWIKQFSEQEDDTAAEMLRHLMEAKGVSQAEVHRETGIAKSTISEVLADRKPFSRKIIRILADYFDVSTSVLAHNI